ncbi:MAG: D-2-hydroxyacid dehydrogenase [Ginsengibacter sp.]
MQIVITDGYTLNPGDLSWEAFEKLGELKYYDRTPVTQVTGRCREATVIITNKTPITADTIYSATDLKLIAVSATGYNIVDVKAAKDKGVLVCNVPEYGTDSVAQHTFALLLELTNHVGTHAQSVANGEWVRSADWSYVKAPIVELSGKTIGIIGFGRIGQKVAAIAKSLGMNVIFYNKNKQSPLAASVTLEALFAQSDVVSLHCPLKEDNREFVNVKLLSLMKPTAFLINTSRGQLVNEQDLADALQGNMLAAAVLDVLSAEPPADTNPLIGLQNCIITPHNAWISFEARQRLMQMTLDNILNALAGKAVNVVSR